MLPFRSRCLFAFGFLGGGLAVVSDSFAGDPLGRDPGASTGSRAGAPAALPASPATSSRQAKSVDLRFEMTPTTSGSGVTVDKVERGKADEASPPSPARPLPSLIRDCLDVRIRYDARPPYIEEPVRCPGLEMDPAPDGPRMGALKNLLEREFFRQLRSRLKHEWRTQFQEMPNISYSRYEERLIAINRIGRDDFSSEMAESEYYTGRVRGEVFSRYPEGEVDIPVLELGPLMLMDSGSLSLDASSIRKALTGADDAEDDDREAERCLVSGKGYRINTRFRLDFNPLKGFARGDPMQSFRSYGVVLDVIWLSDILKRERFRTEVEAEYDHGGNMALFLNFVLKSW